MKKYQLNNKILLLVLILLLFFINGCSGVYQNMHEQQEENKIKPVYSIKLKTYNSDVVKDCTPEFAIFTDDENIFAMSFSGDGESWSGWVDYSENYEQFNIASGLNGTTMQSGNKIVYIRFKDSNGTIIPRGFQEPVFCSFEYEMQELFSIKIEPNEVQVKPGAQQNFIVRGYDYCSKNEVPVNGEKIEWSKPCAVGMFSSTYGLQTTYTAPEKYGIWNLSAHYGSLGAGAKVHVVDE
jgi:hypothetical protein